VHRVCNEARLCQLGWKIVVQIAQTVQFIQTVCDRRLVCRYILH
jgi:hypothetical protein